MIREDRVLIALRLANEARKDIEEGDLNPDPVTQRRLDARAAGRLRRAANFLDDNGRLGDD